MVKLKRAERVVLVNDEDEKVGLMEIEEAHLGVGELHRAISVLLHDGEGRVLIQKRSNKKKLWPGFWSNTTCTHRNFRGDHVDWAVRRAKDELGIVLEKSKLSLLYVFKYQARYDERYSEHEVDSVIVGRYVGEVKPNSEEVAEVLWIDFDDLKEEVYRNSDRYTPWFKLMLENKKVEKAVT